MKTNKYLPFYIFFGLMIVGVLAQKFFGQRGIGNLLPGEPRSWAEILKNLPWATFVCVVFTFIIVRAIKEMKNMYEKSLVNAHKRIEEREKAYSTPNTHECKVCGCYSENFPWGEDGKSPSYQICTCCGVQFGKEDSTLESIKEYRTEWISKGGVWFAKKERPDGWNIELQIENIPEKFR